jgi:hypothetical protein
MHDIKKLMSMVSGDEMKMNKLSHLIKNLIENSDRPDKYEMDIYLLENGYHFNEDMYKKATEGMECKWTPETVVSLLSSHGITFSGEYECVTMYDKAYVMNTIYKMYYPLIADSSAAAKFTEKFIKCKYPVTGGRAFAEWSHKCWLKSELGI